MGKGVDSVVCRKVVRNNLKSILRNESALLWLSRIKNQDNYTSQHCLAVSVMAMGFGRHLGIGEDELEVLGLAGLLHDVGKIKVDQQVLNKPGKLSGAELEHIKTHAGFGYRLLVGHEDLPASVAEAAYGHHERLDGSGYPRQLMGDLISRITRIISIVDCFDAITSNRIYDRARTVKDAFKVLMDLRECQFDAELVMRFIEWLGIFPVGTLVELHTGEVGLVVEKHPRLQLRPKVVVLIDEAGKRCAPRFLDLAKVTVDAQAKPYRITAGLPDGALGLFMSDADVQALLNDHQLESLDDEDEVLDTLSHWHRVPAQTS
jgi:HD-GYP domain-containing protein (c-di-GMP phosphodiesterase class II)